MGNEREYTIEAFFALIRAGLWETEVRLASYGEVDYERILRITREQSVVGLVAAGLEHVTDVKAPQADVLQFVGETIQLEQRNSEMNRFIADLVIKMRRVGIYTLLVKGQGVAQCYERPLWRACGDVDFFLSDDNYQKAKEMLIPLASEIEKESNKTKHLGLTIDSWVVELHGSLRMGMPSKINRELDLIKQETFYGGDVSSWTNGGTQVFLLSHENDVVYVFTHFLNHFYKGGIGLRQICDWSRLLWVYRSNLDLKKIKKHIESMGLMTEWKAFGAFAVNYLGLPKEALPFYDEDSKWNRKARRIKDFIIMSGNFGHNRDMSYYSKYPYLIRKIKSLGIRIGDLLNHSRIFPLDTIRFAPSFLFHGLRAAVNGE